ncbi:MULTISPECIES: hypothetical protein [unclassified Lysinibacillus]|uniref:hypothetical protein n=1 Tax=unclassified Lysinibacillus TaxID=2636778 RepID=UPI00382B82E1
MKSIFAKIKESFINTTPKVPKKDCYFCKRKASDLRNYKNERSQKIKVCYLCIEYAERRAYRK